MEEASLEDEAQYAGAAHPLLLPPCHKGTAVTMASFSFQPDQTVLEVANDKGARQLDNRVGPQPQNEDRH